MSSDKTLIFSDLDGTLLDHYSYSADAAKTTLAQLKAANIPVILTTSKTYAEVIELQDKLSIDAPFIVENGAAIYLPKSIFITQPDDTIDDGNYWLKCFCQPRAHWLEMLATLSDKFNGSYLGFSQMSVEQLMEITGLDHAAATQAKARAFGEPIQWLGDEASKSAFIKQLKQRGAVVLHGGRFIHVSGLCDKGKALSWLSHCYQKHLYQQAPTTIALGDGGNDVAMLTVADYAVQIRSPVHDFPALTRANKTIQTTKFGPHGWAESINAILFNNNQKN